MFRFVLFFGCCLTAVAYGANIANIPTPMRYMPYKDKNGNIQYEDIFSNKPEMKPMGVTLSQVKFRLHTHNSPLQPELIIAASNYTPLYNYNLDKTLPVVITIHGWRGRLEEEVNVDVTASTLQKGNANVFVVDWTEPAEAFYTTAMYYVKDVGIIVGDFILRLREMGIPRENFKIIGFSLGAHVAGFAGKNIRDISKPTPLIIGLDPAGPFFSGIFVDSSERLHKTDAEVVQIVHCNTDFAGTSEVIGTVDFFPNSGKTQEGCGLDLTGSCSHMRCPVLYAECMRKDYGCMSRKAKSYKDFLNGKFIGSPTPMGVFDLSITGNYYLKTYGTPPYSLE